jgi:hypothetical protein
MKNPTRKRDWIMIVRSKKVKIIIEHEYRINSTEYNDRGDEFTSDEEFREAIFNLEGDPANILAILEDIASMPNLTVTMIIDNESKVVYECEPE